MQKINKTTSTPLAMGFLFLSVALLPFSMKAIGFEISISPRVGAVVEAWTQVAGVFVVGYHPFSADSWSSLDNLKISDTPESTPESGEQCSLIAQLYNFRSGEDCALPEKPVEVESTPVMEVRSSGPQVIRRAGSRLNARQATMSGLAPVAEAITVKAEDDVIVKVSANLPALAIRYVRSFNPRTAPAAKPVKMKRGEREAFKSEINRFMRSAKFEKSATANTAFHFQVGDKNDHIECDVDQVTNPARVPESLERVRRVRAVESQETHEL